METSKPRRTSWEIVGAMSAAFFASVCCVVPLVLVSLGIGGAWVGYLTALEPFRPFFITLALAALGYAFWREYKTSTDLECDCDPRFGANTRRGFLAVATLATVGLIGSPYLISTNGNESIAEIEGHANLQTTTLIIEGMTCATCTTTAEKALSQQSGVASAVVTYEPPQAIVIYDAESVSPAELARAITNSGYRTFVKEGEKTQLEDL